MKRKIGTYVHAVRLWRERLEDRVANGDNVITLLGNNRNSLSLGWTLTDWTIGIEIASDRHGRDRWIGIALGPIAIGYLGWRPDPLRVAS